MAETDGFVHFLYKEGTFPPPLSNPHQNDKGVIPPGVEVEHTQKGGKKGQYKPWFQKVRLPGVDMDGGWTGGVYLVLRGGNPPPTPN